MIDLAPERSIASRIVVGFDMSPSNHVTSFNFSADINKLGRRSSFLRSTAIIFTPAVLNRCKTQLPIHPLAPVMMTGAEKSFLSTGKRSVILALWEFIALNLHR